MIILPIHPEIDAYIKKHALGRKFEKKKNFLEQNPFHPSLRTELLEPRQMKIWSFRIDQKYRAIFIFKDRETIEILDVNNHYR